MRAGSLRKRVTVLKPVETTDADSGEVIVSQVATGQRWAAVESLSGRELWEAQQVESRATVRVRMRYYDGLTTDHRLTVGGRTLEIVHAGDPEGRERVTEVLCVEGG